MRHLGYSYSPKGLGNRILFNISILFLALCSTRNTFAKIPMEHKGNKEPYAHEPVIASDLISLETETWTARPGSLSKLEQRIISNLQEDSKNAFLHYLLSHLYLRRYLEQGSDVKNLKVAGELAEQAIQLNPNDESGYLAMAHILSVLGKREQARLMIETFRSQASSVTSWRTSLQHTKLLGTQYDTKIQLLTMNKLMQSGANPQLVIPFAIVLLEQTYSGAELLDQFRAWLKSYPHPIMAMSLALNLSRQNKFKEANSVLGKLRKNGIDDGRYPEAAINQAMILYQHLGEPGRARAILQKALNSSKHDKLIAAMMLTHLAVIDLKQREFKKAKGSFMTALLNGQENHWSTLNHIVRKYIEQDAASDLIDLLETLVLKMPGDDRHHGLLGDLYSQYLSNKNKAMLSYQNAALLNPIEAEYLSKIAFFHYQDGDFENAETYFGKAAKLKPLDAAALYNHACALALNQEVDSALAVLERAIDIDGGIKKLAREDKDFFALKDLPHFRLLTNHVSVDEPQ